MSINYYADVYCLFLVNKIAKAHPLLAWLIVGFLSSDLCEITMLPF